MHICNQRAYLLTQLKSPGLSLAQLQQVFSSIILARVLYDAPALRGYLSSTYKLFATVFGQSQAMEHYRL